MDSADDLLPLKLTMKCAGRSRSSADEEWTKSSGRDLLANWPPATLMDVSRFMDCDGFITLADSMSLGPH